jgi:hypothetical protein
MFESLEPRRLFSVTLSMDGSVLHVTGSGDADRIAVLQDTAGGDFSVRVDSGSGFEEAASIPESMVTRVVLDGGAGNDFLVEQTAGAVGVDVLGGDGNDEIHLIDLGTAVSIGHGGNDDDLLVIFQGNGTTAYGDNGSDTLISHESVNTTYLFGGNAKDGLTGTDVTIMDGGNGKDIITTT